MFPLITPGRSTQCSSLYELVSSKTVSWLYLSSFHRETSLYRVEYALHSTRWQLLTVFPVWFPQGRVRSYPHFGSSPRMGRSRRSYQASTTEYPRSPDFYPSRRCDAAVLRHYYSPRLAHCKWHAGGPACFLCMPCTMMHAMHYATCHALSYMPCTLLHAMHSATCHALC